MPTARPPKSAQPTRAELRDRVRDLIALRVRLARAWAAALLRQVLRGEVEQTAEEREEAVGMLRGYFTDAEFERIRAECRR